MSLINDMLRDLDERNGKEDLSQRERVASVLGVMDEPRVWYRRPVPLSVVALALCGGVAAVILWPSMNPLAQDPSSPIASSIVEPPAPVEAAPDPELDAVALVDVSAIRVSESPDQQPLAFEAGVEEARNLSPASGEERVDLVEETSALASPDAQGDMSQKTASRLPPTEPSPETAPAQEEAPLEVSSSMPSSPQFVAKPSPETGVAGVSPEVRTESRPAPVKAIPSLTQPAVKPVARNERAPAPETRIANARQSEQKLLDRADKRLRAGRQAEAERGMRRELVSDPGMHRLRLLLVKSLLSHDAVAARRVAMEGLTLLPNHHPYRLALANGYMRSRDYEAAVSVLSEQRPPMSDALDYYTTLAAVLQYTGDYAASEQIYLQLLQLQDANSRWVLGLAIAQDQLGQYPDARVNYQKVLVMAGVDSASRSYAQQQVLRLQRMEVQ
ncbi:hypothetical protein [Aestuariirhabdus sp. LZHN29]|uniref:tetratricopeptide repeat protein n=1 Tax=Aestuariirhabdus sp. LZHN29 TaxID=3417462 RepID=UPI003CF7A1A7